MTSRSLETRAVQTMLSRNRRRISQSRIKDPQAGHAFGSVAPHSTQNFFPAPVFCSTCLATHFGSRYTFKDGKTLAAPANQAIRLPDVKQTEYCVWVAAADQ